MTKRQSEVFGFIDEFIASRGYSPTLREIGDGLGMKSLATIHKHLTNLERDKHITRGRNRPASIRLIVKCPRCGRTDGE